MVGYHPVVEAEGYQDKGKFTSLGQGEGKEGVLSTSQ